MALSHPPHEVEGDPSLEALNEAIEHGAHLLPAQGPISVFIHHNTLHGFEHLPFEEAVKVGARVFGCQPYLSEDAYREALKRGRIRFSECRDVLREDLGERADEMVAGLVRRLDLRLAMLHDPLRTGTAEEVGWFVAETAALRKVRPEASAPARDRLLSETRRWVMRDLRVWAGGQNVGPVPEWAPELLQRYGSRRIEEWSELHWEAFSLEALWRVCLAAVQATDPPPAESARPIRHRDLLLELTGVDTDLLVHEPLIRITAAFLDQGLAHWPLPGREQGLFPAFCTLYRQPLGPPDRWRSGLAAELGRIQDAGTGALASALESLEELGVGPEEWSSYLEASLLALRGWGGMVHQIAIRGDRVAHPIPSDSLVDFVAVRLLLERFALRTVARDELDYEGPLAGLREALRRRLPSVPPPADEPRAHVLYQLAQALGWSPEDLVRLTPTGWSELVSEIEGFTGVERRRVFHLAFERRLRNQTLDAIALHEGEARDPERRPRFQLMCCLDEREESFRRHVEEIEPEVETFGVAGFFGAAIYYRGAAEAHFVPLCPVVIRPRHWLTEQVADEHEEAHRRRARLRRLLGFVTHGVASGSRKVATGAVLTATFGTLATIPLVMRLLFPRLAGRVTNRLRDLVRIPARTDLTLERDAEEPGSVNGGLGFRVTEMAAVAERLLRDIGLYGPFARLVLILGHGSDSLNNPHKSAYDCGACGGSPGGPNARAAARMLNDPRVRSELAGRGIVVPADVHFVGGLHNTCDDSVTLFDTERVPATHLADFEAAERVLAAACERNAQERCRRFVSAPLGLSAPDARRHVEERSEDLAQTRPELGHATNALCFVGRRSWSRGLYLDRRAFLTSYDPDRDRQDHGVLAGILAAVFPVCAGINLEYYFSRVDNVGWGSGSKLPHNVTALVGVMDGAASDLRTGLPWQMVEIHEPVRLLMVIEATPETFRSIAAANPGAIGRVVENGWVQLALRDPHTGRLSVFQRGEFVPYTPQASDLPSARGSADWFRGWRDHLEFAEIDAATYLPTT